MTGSSEFDLMAPRRADAVGALIGMLAGVAASKARRRFRPQPARGTDHGGDCHQGAAQIL